MCAIVAAVPVPKASFSFPGLQDRAIAKTTVQNVTVHNDAVKKVKKIAEPTATKKLILNRPKY